jgi:hypothetical protein
MHTIANNEVSILTELIKSEILPDQEPHLIKFDDNFECNKIQIDNSFLESSYNLENNNEISYRLEDYYKIEPTFTKCLEESGSENSLFLAISRSLLYKIYFENENYKHIFKNIYFKNMRYKINSDICIQRLLRRKLCIYWLSKVKNSQFIKGSTYSKYDLNYFFYLF